MINVNTLVVDVNGVPLFTTLSNVERHSLHTVHSTADGTSTSDVNNGMQHR